MNLCDIIIMKERDIMIEQIEKILNEVKKEYDKNPILSTKEAISGSSICEKMLMALSKIKQSQVSDDEKVRLFKEYIAEEIENVKELELYEPLMSAANYNLGNLETIEKRIFGEESKKR